MRLHKQRESLRMADVDRDTPLRLAAFEHVRKLGETHDHLTVIELKPGFVFEGSSDTSPGLCSFCVRPAPGRPPSACRHRHGDGGPHRPCARGSHRRGKPGAHPYRRTAGPLRVRGQAGALALEGAWAAVR